MFTVAAFYRFASLPDAAVLRPALLAACAGLELKGTILLATEGINGTVAGSPSAIADLLGLLRGKALFAGRLAGLEAKMSTAREMPFGRLKVRLKREIITLGAPEADPTLLAGTDVPAKDWNALVDDPAVTVIDTRNAFEVAMGSFAGAWDPGLARFSDFSNYAAHALDPARNGPVALFCTGGIRCEKASALLLSRGFDAVYQLQGGILRYLETVPPEQSRWRGRCFVFDERVALGHGLVEAPEAAHG